MIVSDLVPVAVWAVVETVRVDVPPPATEDGAKAAVAPEGNPLTLKVTVPTKPQHPVTVTV